PRTAVPDAPPRANPTGAPRSHPDPHPSPPPPAPAVRHRPRHRHAHAEADGDAHADADAAADGRPDPDTHATRYPAPRAYPRRGRRGGRAFAAEYKHRRNPERTWGRSLADPVGIGRRVDVRPRHDARTE